jgi:hypothetical protein
VRKIDLRRIKPGWVGSLKISDLRYGYLSLRYGYIKQIQKSYLLILIQPISDKQIRCTGTETDTTSKWKTENRRRKTEDRRQKTKDKRQKTEDKRQKTQ